LRAAIVALRHDLTTVTISGSEGLASVTTRPTRLLIDVAASILVFWALMMISAAALPLALTLRK
jgi:hypothetical protein